MKNKISDELLQNRLDYFVWAWTEDESYRMRSYSTSEEEAKLYEDEDKMFEQFRAKVSRLKPDQSFELFERICKHYQKRWEEGVIPIGRGVSLIWDAMNREDKTFNFTEEQRKKMIEQLLEMKWLLHEDASMDEVHRMLFDYFGINLGYSHKTDNPTDYPNDTKESFILRSQKLINETLAEKGEEPIDWD